MGSSGSPRRDRRAGARLEIRQFLVDAEHAARTEDHEASRAIFVQAGDCAIRHQLWTAAARCYRGALELDLVAHDVVARLVSLDERLSTGCDWREYAYALTRSPGWPHFECRRARILTGDSGSLVECAGVGPVLELTMPHVNLVEIYPDGRFAGMPIAMALLILRRALWPRPQERADAPACVQVMFRGTHGCLDELGEWAST